jgi:hypothetical protein
MCRRLSRGHSDIVYPFLGSGSTPIAADKRDPTGNQAVFVETGETFEALATQDAKTGVGLRPPPAVADEPPRTGGCHRSSAGACTADVRGSNPLSSTRKST